MKSSSIGLSHGMEHYNLGMADNKNHGTDLKDH